MAVTSFSQFGPKAEHLSFTSLQFGYADDFSLQQQFSPPKGSIRYVQFGRRFEIGRLRHSQLTAVEERQEVPPFTSRPRSA